MRFILDLKDHPYLSKKFDEFEKTSKSHEERLEFLRRQMENFSTEVEKHQESFWGEVSTYAGAKGLLPSDYSKDSYCLHYSPESGQIFTHKNKDSDAHGTHPHGGGPHIQSFSVGSIEELFSLLSKGPPK